jgi:hypothetical protein
MKIRKLIICLVLYICAFMTSIIYSCNTKIENEPSLNNHKLLFLIGMMCDYQPAFCFYENDTKTVTVFFSNETNIEKIFVSVGNSLLKEMGRDEKVKIHKSYFDFAQSRTLLNYIKPYFILNSSENINKVIYEGKNTKTVNIEPNSSIFDSIESNDIIYFLAGLFCRYGKENYLKLSEYGNIFEKINKKHRFFSLSKEKMIGYDPGYIPKLYFQSAELNEKIVIEIIESFSI